MAPTTLVELSKDQVRRITKALANQQIPFDCELLQLMEESGINVPASVQAQERSSRFSAQPPRLQRFLAIGQGGVLMEPSSITKKPVWTPSPESLMALLTSDALDPTIVAAYDTTGGKVAVMFVAGSMLQEWMYVPLSGEPAQLGHDILVKKSAVVRERGMSCKDAKIKADTGGYKVTDLVPEGTIFLGAVPVFFDAHLVGAIVAVTGGNGETFDEVYATMIASAIMVGFDRSLMS